MTHVRVALVDDQTLFRSALAMLIEAEAGLQLVGEAADGAAGVTLVRAERPDVVLMDLRMPGTDGLAATRQIGADQSLADVRIIVLTMVETESAVHEALAAGASGYLLKDTTPERLVEAIVQVHAGESLLSPQITRRLISHYVETGRVTRRPLPDLTPRETEVLVLVAQGLSNAEVEQRLFIGHATMKSHMAALLRKTGARDRAQLVVRAHEAGLVGPLR